MDEQKRNKINLWMFPLGTVGRDMMYSLFNSFLLTYVLFTRNLTAAQLQSLFAPHGAKLKISCTRGQTPAEFDSPRMGAK